jgi:hypothetical protein
MTSDPGPTQISAEQTAREANLREVGEAMAAIEAAARRIQKSADTLKSLRSGDLKIISALLRCSAELEASRRRLHHEGYLGEPQIALFVHEVEDSNSTKLPLPGEPEAK